MTGITDRVDFTFDISQEDFGFAMMPAAFNNGDVLGPQALRCSTRAPTSNGARATCHIRAVRGVRFADRLHDVRRDVALAQRMVSVDRSKWPRRGEFDHSRKALVVDAAPGASSQTGGPDMHMHPHGWSAEWQKVYAVRLLVPPQRRASNLCCGKRRPLSADQAIGSGTAATGTLGDHELVAEHHPSEVNGFMNS